MKNTNRTSKMETAQKQCDAVDTVVAFINEQMDGEQVPPHNSEKVANLLEALCVLKNMARGDDCWQLLGAGVLLAIGTRVRSAVAAEGTLHAFIRGGRGDHA